MVPGVVCSRMLADKSLSRCRMGGGAAFGAGVNAVAVVVGAVDGAVRGDAGDAQLGWEAVEGRCGRGTEAFAHLVGGADEREGGWGGHDGAEDVGVDGVR